MPRITRRRSILFATESAFGTAATLSAGNVFHAFQPMLQYENQADDRDPTGTLGPIASVPGARGAKVSFDLELAGGLSAAVEPSWATVLFPACGVVAATAHIYKPTSNPANYKSLTMAVAESGPAGTTWKLATGCMGTFKVSGENGKRIMTSFDFTGVWADPTDTAFPTLPALPPIPPRLAGATMTIGAYTPNFTKFDFDYGGVVTRVPAVNTISGYAYALLTSRRCRGTIDPDADTVANFSVYQQILAMTQSAFSLAVPTPAGGTITLAAPAFQTINATEGDRNGLTTENIDFQFNQSAGDDDFTLTFA